MPPQTTATRTVRARGAFDQVDLDALLATGTGRSHLDASSGPAPAAHVSEQASNEATAPTSRNDVFRLYAEYRARLIAAANKQADFERQLLGFSMTTPAGTEDILDLANKAINLMIHEARQKFDTPHTTLRIDLEDIIEGAGQAGWRERYQDARRKRDRNATEALPQVPVDLDAIWAFIDKSYGGDAGVQAMYRQIAPMLVERLHLNDEKNIKRTAKHIVAYVHVRSEDANWARVDGRRKLAWDDRRYVAEVVDGLSHAFKWAGLTKLGEELDPQRNLMGGYDFVYTSRETFSFDGLDIVTYKDYWDVKLAHATAEKLKLFLGEFCA